MYCYKVKRSKNYFFIISLFIILIIGGTFFFNFFFNNETQGEYNTTKLSLENNVNTQYNKYETLENAMKAVVRNIKC